MAHVYDLSDAELFLYKNEINRSLDNLAYKIFKGGEEEKDRYDKLKEVLKIINETIESRLDALIRHNIKK